MVKPDLDPFAVLMVTEFLVSQKAPDGNLPFYAEVYHEVGLWGEAASRDVSFRAQRFG